MARREHVGRQESGFTIIEVIVATFVIGTVVTGIFGLFVLGLRTSQDSERRIVAVGLANERMEMVRNLPYVDVGTAGGVPTGTIPQVETIERNGMEFTVETDIRYVDDDYDGVVVGEVEEEDRVTLCHRPGTPQEQTLEVGQPALDAHLAHGDTAGACGVGGEGTPPGDEYNADYKSVRVEVSWANIGILSPIVLISHVVPEGVEGSELGGTLDFQALDAQGLGVPGATVQIINDVLDPPINVSTVTNAEGHVVLPGLPPEVESYELLVSKEGFTSEQTYDTTGTFIPDPDYSHLSMIVKQVTSKTFALDVVGEVNLSFVDEAAASLADVAYTLVGTKRIGEDDTGTAVLRENRAGTSAVDGAASEEDLVWDSYQLVVDGATTGYDIKETSEVLPLAVNPGDVKDITVTLVPHVPISLHVTVVGEDGLPIDNTTVRLYNGGAYDQSQATGVVGQVYFGDIVASGDYSLDVSAPGYVDLVGAPVSAVDGTDRIKIEMVSS